MSSLKPLGHHWWLITSRCIALLLRTVCPLLRTPTYSMETLWIEERNLQRLSSFCLPSYCSTPTTCIWTEATMRTTSWTSGNMLDHPFKGLLKAWLLIKKLKALPWSIHSGGEKHNVLQMVYRELDALQFFFFQTEF